MYVFWPKRRMCAKNTPPALCPPSSSRLRVEIQVWKCFPVGAFSARPRCAGRCRRSARLQERQRCLCHRAFLAAACPCLCRGAGCVGFSLFSLPGRRCCRCQGGVLALQRAHSSSAPLMWLRCRSAVRLSRLLLSELARGYSLGPCFSTAWCGVGVLEPADHTHMLVSPSLGCLLCRE